MILRFGVELPERSDLPALPRGVVLHWTGGTLRANAIDRAAYHYIVEGDGTAVSGKWPVAANMRKCGGSGYAAHTGGFNSWRVGLSAAGMRGYVSPSRPGDQPITESQVRRMMELAAYFCALGKLDPLNPLHLCTHEEVWRIHGVKGKQNHLKTDITFLPFKSDLQRIEVGPYLRTMAARMMGSPLAGIEVTPTIAFPRSACCAVR